MLWVIYWQRIPPPPELELLTEDFVQETGVWRLIAIYPTETMKQKKLNKNKSGVHNLLKHILV